MPLGSVNALSQDGPAPTFNTPISLAFDGKFLWVADMGSSLARKVDPGLPGIVKAIDLSSYGVTQSREVLFNNNLLYYCCHDSHLFIIIDPSTDQVVGKFTVPDRARYVAFDGAGNFWAASTDTSSLNYYTLFKVSIASTLAAFPGEAAATYTAKYSHHLEQIVFANSFFWVSNGGARNIEFGDEYIVGESASIVASGASATVTGLSGMTSDMVGASIFFQGTSSISNSVAFKITSFISSSSVTISGYFNNPLTDANNGNIFWGFIRGSAGGEALTRIDPNETRQGTTASITVTGTWPSLTVTISGLSGMTNADIGSSISINNATGTCFGGQNNNTYFRIQSVTNPTTVVTDIGSSNKGRYPPSFSNCFGIPVTDANNGNLHWTLCVYHVTIDTDNGYIWSVGSGFGSLWSGNGFHALTRWNPSTYHPIPQMFPAPSNPILIKSPTNKKFFQGPFIVAGSHMWTTAGYGGSGSHAAIRIDPATNTIIAEIPTDDTSAWADGIAYDGRDIWVTVRNNARPGLVRIRTNLGHEAVTFHLGI